MVARLPALMLLHPGASRPGPSLRINCLILLLHEHFCSLYKCGHKRAPKPALEPGRSVLVDREQWLEVQGSSRTCSRQATVSSSAARRSTHMQVGCIPSLTHLQRSHRGQDCIPVADLPHGVHESNRAGQSKQHQLTCSVPTDESTMQ